MIREGIRMSTNFIANRLSEVVSLGSAKCRVVALASAVGLSGVTGLGLLGIGIISAVPAQATCRLNGNTNNDVADRDCPEAQQTGCIKHRMPSQAAYNDCLERNRQAEQSGRV